MKPTIKTDISRALLKNKKVRIAMTQSLVSSLAVIASALFSRAQRNLKGPHYGPPDYRGPKTGEMPVPRITSLAARSLKRRKFNDLLWAVYADSKIAKYIGFIHDGTKWTKPRRFLGDVVTTNQTAWLSFIKVKMFAAIKAAQV